MKKSYDIGYTDGKHEPMQLTDEEVRMLRFNTTKKVSTILPLGYNPYKKTSTVSMNRSY